MSEIQICTRESMLDGGLEGRGKCAICLTVEHLKCGYLDIKCSGCGNIYSADHGGEVVRKRRERLGLSVEEVAEAYGVEGDTIKKYEYRYPAMRYQEFTARLIEGQNDYEETKNDWS